ncbi:MAG: hypothetical protein ACLR8P_16955 [Clostridium fessum]
MAALVVENASLFYYLPVLLASRNVKWGADWASRRNPYETRLKCLDLTKFM